MEDRKKAVVIGATSGIGRELAKTLALKGYTVGLMGRRSGVLAEVQKSIGTVTFAGRIDLRNPDEGRRKLEELVKEMGGLDVVVICSGVCYDNRELAWSKEKETIDVNVSGFTAIVDKVYDLFAREGMGHIVGISSIRAFRGGWSSPAYNASKAFVGNYLEGLRFKAAKEGLDIHVTNIVPGFVDTPMIKDRKDRRLVVSVENAAELIMNSIERKKRIAYVPKKWAVICAILRVMPDWAYKRL